MCGEINPTNVTLIVTLKITGYNTLEPKLNDLVGNWELGGYGFTLYPDKTIMPIVFISEKYNTKIRVPVEYNIDYVMATSYDGQNLNFYLNDYFTTNADGPGVIKPPLYQTYFMIGGNPNGTKMTGPTANLEVYSVLIYD